MSDDLLAKLQGLLGDSDLARRVAGLAGGAGGAGGFDPGMLLAGLQANPDLMSALVAKLGPNPLAVLSGILPGGGQGQGGLDLGALGGLAGGGEGKGPDVPGIGDALGGMFGKRD